MYQTYVQYGGADMGVMGKRCINETRADVIIRAPGFKIAKCWLMTAGPKDALSVTKGRLGRNKVCHTGQKLLCQQRFASRDYPLNGAMELVWILGLADEIVDIVDTGNTLKANGLEARELIHMG